MSEDPTQGQRTINLAALAGEAVVMLDARAEERSIRLEIETREELPASGEERAVIQILVNLIGNAVRHSPDGGTVELAFAKTPGTASVTVSDHGPGIDPADQQRIFERFERADAKSGGTRPRPGSFRRGFPPGGGGRHPRNRPRRGGAGHAAP